MRGRGASEFDLIGADLAGRGAPTDTTIETLDCLLTALGSSTSTADNGW